MNNQHVTPSCSEFMSVCLVPAQVHPELYFHKMRYPLLSSKIYLPALPQPQTISSSDGFGSQSRLCLSPHVFCRANECTISDWIVWHRAVSVPAPEIYLSENGKENTP
jgi:hypothetical protein